MGKGTNGRFALADGLPESRKGDPHVDSTQDAREVATGRPDPLASLTPLLASGMGIVEALDLIAEVDPDAAMSAFLTWGDGKWMIDLDLSGRSWVRSLPESMDIRDTLELRDCLNLRSLPNCLSAGTYINIQGCESWDHILPAGLDIPGAVILADLGTFVGPFTPHGRIATTDGLYDLGGPPRS